RLPPCVRVERSIFTRSTRSRPPGGSRFAKRDPRGVDERPGLRFFSGPRHLSGVKTDPVVNSQQGSGRWYLARQGDSPGNQQEELDGASPAKQLPGRDEHGLLITQVIRG